MSLNMNGEFRRPFGMGISVNNVNEALPLGLQCLQTLGVPTSSRGIDTIRMNGPVSTVYARPRERVLFDRVRDANPFFHLIESLWILAGSNTVNLPCMFLPSLLQFSDDGKTFHGAYGYRLARAFGIDQLDEAVELLSTKPDTRQAVLSIWHSELDLNIQTKDTPCNDMIMLDIVDGALNMTVNNRSNDAIWGAYGANAVQFSMIQEWLAISIGVDVGVYVQQSNNFHVYPSNPFWQEFLNGNHDGGHVSNPYLSQSVCPFPLASDPSDAMLFRGDCAVLAALADRGATFTELAEHGYKTRYFQDVVVPMVLAYREHRAKNYDRAVELTHAIHAEDWRLACTEWVERRKAKHETQVLLAAHDISKADEA